jgi:hypothetical protein
MRDEDHHAMQIDLRRALARPGQTVEHVVQLAVTADARAVRTRKPRVLETVERFLRVVGLGLLARFS